VIWNKYKCLHIHIPRTAGTSIVNMLGLSPEDRHSKRRAVHRTIHEFDRQDYFKFTFVRNPWDRMVSYFSWRKVKDIGKKSGVVTEVGAGNHKKFNYINKLDFKYWVKNLHELGYDTQHTRNQLDWICKDQWSWNHIKQEYDYRPKKIELKMDFVGRFENFEHDWNVVVSNLGVAHKEQRGIWDKYGKFIPIEITSLLHKRPSEHKAYWKYYDDESIEIVRQRHEDDVNFFDYKFGEI